MITISPDQFEVLLPHLLASGLSIMGDVGRFVRLFIFLPQKGVLVT
jgi:hypothetical protein